MKRIKLFFINALLLAGGTILMHFIGLSFQVYLVSKIGSTGIGLYQLIMSVYFLAVTLAVSGVKFAVTRLVALELAVDNRAGVRKAMRCCVTYALIFGFGSAFLLYMGSDFICLHWLNIDALPSLRLLALGLPTVSMSCVISGYFIAVRGVVKNVSVQIFEQLCRIALTVTAFTLLMPKGIKYSCLAMVAGSVTAEVISCIVSYLLYQIDRRKYNTNKPPPAGMTRKMLGIALPIAFSAYVRAALNTAESLLTPYGLKKSGISTESALSTYGIVRGMAMPILFFPAAFLHAASDLLIPELSEFYAQGKRRSIHYTVNRVLQITSLFAIGMSGLFYSFSEELSLLIYNSNETAQVIRILAPLIPFIYIDEAVDGMLKGLGEQVSSMRYNIIDSLAGVIMIWFLLPRYAIKGYMITIFATELLNFFLSSTRLMKVTQLRADIMKLLLKPIFGITGAVCASKVLFRFLQLPPEPSVASLCLQILCTLGIYVLFLILSSCITREDFQWFVNIFK